MASFTCATRLSSGAATFVPRRLTSPFDATTCQQDSDCGSSSGLGGMKTQEMASDEGGSSSSSPQPVPFYPRPNSLSAGLPCIPPIPVAPNGLPSWIHPTPPGANNDLFVHVQMGETLSVVVGNGEVQHIQGPATVRMVGESGISPSALPIHVPPGHMIHQIVDDQGILRHLILSPETPSRYPPSVATPSSGIGSRLTSPPLPPFHPSFYTVNRKWAQHGGKMAPAPNAAPAARDEEPEGDIDSEEYDRVREMLSRILSPQIIRVTPTEADIAWQELDTSEAAAPGGPFPQIDASEFSYQIVLFENHGRFVSSYRCEPETGNKLRLCQLRPNTDYYVQLKASLEERGLMGEPSQPVSFKTAPGLPEPPLMPRVLAKASDWISISWRSPNDNGAPILSFSVYLTKSCDGEIEKVWEGRGCEAKIANLTPSTSYRLKVTATNRIGESAESPPLSVATRSDAPPTQPAPPNVVSVGTRTVKLSWSNSPELQYTVEMHDVAAGSSAISVVRERYHGAVATISDLTPGCDYQFRLQSHSTEGDSPKSDWTSAKTTGKLPERNGVSNERLAVPSRPHVVSKSRRKIEVGWKCSGAKDLIYNLEGSTLNHPAKFRTLYKGPQTTCLITEEDIQNIKVQTINKKGLVSDFSETLVLPRVEEEPISKPVQLDTPTLEAVARGAVKASWTAPTIIMPPTASLMFEVRRIDEKSEIVYSGAGNECQIEGLGNRQHVEVQVRAVIIAEDGTRHEGDWSSVAGACAPREPPTAPTQLTLSEDMSVLTWTAPETYSDLMYRVHCCETSDGKTVEERVHETGECRRQLTKLAPACSYTCKVVAFHDGGESSPSEEVHFTTPAAVPAQPESVSIEAENTTVLLLRWTAPDCRGEPIQQYHIKVDSRGEMVRECVLATTSDHCEYRICDLSPDTPYRVEVTAENAVGSGASATISGRTRCLPPSPPRLEAEADSSVLRLKWRPPTMHGMLTYKVVRLGEGDHQSNIYDGDLCSFKVRGLTENTEYRFRIRSYDRQTGAGPWSEVYTFHTTIAPPPAVKSAPTATSSGNFCYQIDWTPVLSKPNQRRAQYRLQAVDCSTDNAKWHTVYDGPHSTYTLSTAKYPSAVQVRVLCVRAAADHPEILSSPSPIAYIANHGSTNSNGQAVSDASPVNGERPSLWSRLTADRGTTTIVLVTVFVVLFFMLSFIVAVSFDQLFNLQAPVPPITVPSPAPPPREL